MKIHKVRFIPEESGVHPGKYRKEHEVSTETTKASQVTTWTDTIFLDKTDIEFLLKSEA